MSGQVSYVSAVGRGLARWSEPVSVSAGQGQSLSQPSSLLAGPRDLVSYLLVAFRLPYLLVGRYFIDAAQGWQLLTL